MKNELVMVMCPPYADYKEPPEDQPNCEIFNCPKCKEEMWLSKAKRSLLVFSSCIGKDIILACYRCITKMAKEEPELFQDFVRMDI